jgi:hypothetical protein
MLFGLGAPTRLAASSIAGGIPSIHRESSSTAGAVCGEMSKPVRTARALSTNGSARSLGGAHSQRPHAPDPFGAKAQSATQSTSPSGSAHRQYARTDLRSGSRASCTRSAASARQSRQTRVRIQAPRHLVLHDQFRCGHRPRLCPSHGPLGPMPTSLVMFVGRLQVIRPQRSGISWPTIVDFGGKRTPIWRVRNQRWGTQWDMWSVRKLGSAYSPEWT